MKSGVANKKMLTAGWCLAVALCMVGGMATTCRAQTAIGKWRSCLDNSQAMHVSVADGRVYASVKGGLFYYDTDDNMLSTMSKGFGLSDVGVSTMAYDAETKCLVVAYTNSNVDIVHADKTYNISDIKRSEIAGDKQIFHIRFANGNAYLATGFGVVVVDLDRYEIRETWYLGDGGTHTPIYDMAFTADSIYAATGEGFKSIATNERRPANGSRWTTDHSLDGLHVTALEPTGSRLLMTAHNGNPLLTVAYERTGSGWRAWNEGDILSMRVGARWVVVTRSNAVVRYDTNLAIHDSLTAYTWGNLSGNDAEATDDGTVWVAHSWDGLICVHPDGTDETYHPQGPHSNDNCYRLVPFNHRMMLCPGGHTSTYAKTYLPPDLLTTQGSSWTSLDKSSGLFDGMSDITDAAVNPMDTTETVAAVFGHGIISIRNNMVQQLYNEDNTDGALVPLVANNYRILNTNSVAFDRQGNLWVLTSNSTHTLAVRRRDGSWQGFPTQALGSDLYVDKMVVDSINGYKWFIGRYNIIYVHDGKERMAKVNPNQGSKLSTDAVTAIVQDQSGNIWIGTNKGIKVIYDGYRAFQNGGNGENAPVNCSNITITNGEFAEYLMAYESITAIAVDGANRKWVGTSNGGLYLISSNGLHQMEHFTAANSPLFSDRIICLGINERTGEVYVGTDKGLQVYRGTATYAVKKPLDDVHAFPNPVRPDYDGPIAIKGFTRNGRVHITDASGHTVYTTTAEGGQAIWNGRNLNGEKVASGVYYIFASDEMGDNRAVGKVLLVR